MQQSRDGAPSPTPTEDSEGQVVAPAPLTCPHLPSASGNYCPICTRCYEDNDYDSKMMQCAQCDHWVHAKCEGLSGEWGDVTSALQESLSSPQAFRGQLASMSLAA